MDVDINAVSSLEEITAALQQLDLAEAKVNEKIHALIEQNGKFDEAMLELDEKCPNTDLLNSDAKNLSAMITFASQLAEGVSGKVRQLDLAKSRVHVCIQRVEDILDLKACTEGVARALADEDYERAAGHIHRFSSMDENVLRMTGDASEGSTLEQSFKLLHDAQTKLQAIVTRQFDLAIQTNDAASIERFFKIFPLIGLQEEGLKKFGGFLATVITEKFERHLKASNQLADNGAQGSHLKYANLLTQLFETVAEVMEAYQVQVETYFGPGNLFPLIRTVQSACDQYAQQVLQKHRAARNLNNVVHNVRRELAKPVTMVGMGSDTSPGSVGSAPPGLDAGSLDSLITEIIVMNTRCDLYMRFLRRRALPTELESGDTGPGHGHHGTHHHPPRRIRTTSTNSNSGVSSPPQTPNNPTLTPHSNAPSTTLSTTSRSQVLHFFQDCLLSRRLQEVMADYLLLEEYHLRQMIKKAIQLSTMDEALHQATLVDDVFFIVRKCLRRALSTGNADCGCAMLNQCGRVLEDLFQPALKQLLRPPASFQSFAGQLLANWWGSADTTVSSVTSATASIMASASAGSAMAPTPGGSGGNTEQESAGHALRHFLMGLNSAAAANQYVSNLSQQVGQDIANLFSNAKGASAVERDKLNSCLLEVFNQGQHYQELLDQGFEQLTNGFLRSQVKVLLNSLTSVKYILTDEDLTFSEAHETWVEEYATGLERSMAPFQETLSRPNYDQCIQHVTNETVLRVEKLIMRKSFNHFGGRLLERHLRNLCAYLGQCTTWSVRDKFVRLLQIALILSLDKPDEVYEYCLASTWRLTANESRQVFHLRNDLRSEEIKRLRL